MFLTHIVDTLEDNILNRKIKNRVWYSSVLPKIVPASFILECYDPFDNNMNNEHVWEGQ